MKWFYSDGWSLEDFNAEVTFSDSIDLTDDQKRPFINAVASAASKVLTLGLNPGDTCLVTNIGDTNAFTVKNIVGDTGVSVGTGEVALCIGGTDTADTFAAVVLNASGGSD